jgi:threonine dehydratase
LVSHPLLSGTLGADVFVKLENTQPLGAFKVRGGLNLMASLDTPRIRRGVVAATRGNHGQSLAFAAREFGATCTLVVPEGNNVDKNAAMRSLGARVVVAGDDFDASCAHAAKLASGMGARLVHPGTERALIAGVATIGLELIEQLTAPLDVLFVPVGVGSCIAGISIVMSLLSPRTRIIGVSARAAPAMARAFEREQLVVCPPAETLADGLAVGAPVAETLSVMRGRVECITLVDESDIRSAIVLYARTLHQLAEGAGAVALAAALNWRDRIRGLRVGLVLSGGNIEASALRGVLETRSRPL